MKYDLLYQPSYAVARVKLDLGESVRAESGAMVSMSPSIEMESKMQGGIGKMFGRLLGGESIFQTTFMAKHGPGEVLLAPSGPGDIIAVEPGMGLMVTSGCYLAGDVTLELETQANLRNFFGGEGLFIMRVSGQGTVLLSSFGAIHAVQLAPGQPYIVDTGHLVAFSQGMGYEIRKASRSFIGSFTSGEGLVVQLTGPGIVYIQTRMPQAFASQLSPYLPSRG